MAFEPTPQKPAETEQAVSSNSEEVPPQPPQQTASLPAIPPVKKKRPKWFKPAVIAGAVVLLSGGGAYGYFGVYMQTPENLWRSGLRNTGQGLKKYIEGQPPTSKSTKFNGSFKLSSPIAADGSIEGMMNQKDLTFKANAGTSGVRTNMELRAIVTGENQINPDIYLKVDGLRPIAALLGADVPEVDSLVDQVENKWLYIDRSLLDQALATESDQNVPSAEALDKELRETSKKMATVLNDYLFTTNEAKAVVTIKEALKKEDFKGRKSQHVKAQVRKEQTKEFIKALRETVRGTYWDREFVAAYGSAAEQVGQAPPTLEDLLKELDNVNFDNAVADVWIDTGLRYIRNVRITSTENNATSSIDFTLDYKGGDEFPLSITFSGKDETSEGSINLGMTLNGKSPDVKLTAGVNGTFDQQKVQFTADLSLIASNEELKVEKPTDTTNIMEIVGNLMNQFNEVQSLFGALGGGAAGIEQSQQEAINCAAEYEAYANSNGTTPISPECVQDDTQI